MKLDSFSQKLLEYLNSQENPSSTAYEFYDLAEFEKALDCDGMRIKSAVSYLKEKGYLTYVVDKSGKAQAFYLSHKGLNWKEIDRNERYDFLIKSILVPIVVSLITTALISLATYFWTMSGISIANANQTPANEPITEDASVVNTG